MPDKSLDLRGLKCPLPVLRTRKALAQALPGDIITVECTDPLARIDIPNMVRETGNGMEGQEDLGTLFIFRIRKTPR